MKRHCACPRESIQRNVQHRAYGLPVQVLRFRQKLYFMFPSWQSSKGVGSVSAHGPSKHAMPAERPGSSILQINSSVSRPVNGSRTLSSGMVLHWPPSQSTINVALGGAIGCNCDSAKLGKDLGRVAMSFSSSSKACEQFSYAPKAMQSSPQYSKPSNFATQQRPKLQWPGGSPGPSLQSATSSCTHIPPLLVLHCAQSRRLQFPAGQETRHGLLGRGVVLSAGSRNKQSPLSNKKAEQ
mmetsp:Transcript_62881/g.180910  ORF Transcript_62881/g.180910 Transcript_62881/m.180910 type:complete len:239 (-) Transcript_62881:1155-1871(-)